MLTRIVLRWNGEWISQPCFSEAPWLDEKYRLISTKNVSLRDYFAHVFSCNIENVNFLLYIRRISIRGEIRGERTVDIKNFSVFLISSSLKRFLIFICDAKGKNEKRDKALLNIFSISSLSKKIFPIFIFKHTNKSWNDKELSIMTKAVTRFCFWVFSQRFSQGFSQRFSQGFSQTLTGIRAKGRLAPRRLTTSIRPGRRERHRSFRVSREALRLCDLWSRMQKTRRVTNSVSSDARQFPSKLIGVTETHLLS